MRILQIIPFFTPSMGGSVVSAYHLSKYLSQRGHDVTIFTTDFKHDTEYIRSLDNVQVIPFHCQANLEMLLFSPEMKRQLNHKLKDFDIVHMHNFRTYQNIIAHYYALKYQIPYVLQAHGDIPRAEEKTRLKKIYDVVWGKKIIRDASKLIFSSWVELKETQRDFSISGDKIAFVPNGIDLSEYGRIKKGEFRRKYAIRNDDKLLLFLGRIHDAKGSDLLVHAFSKLNEVYNDTILAFVGPDDGYLSRLTTLVKKLNLTDRVMFVDSLYGIEKFQAYVDADVFVLPSRSESFGNTVLEACACGTPVIASHNCGVNEWIPNDFIYTIDYDVKQLQKGLLAILSDGPIWKNMMLEGSKYVRDKFNWDAVVKRTEEIYQSVLAG